jgi:hypothetical protein
MFTTEFYQFFFVWLPTSIEVQVNNYLFKVLCRVLRCDCLSTCWTGVLGLLCEILKENVVMMLEDVEV